MQQQMAAFRRGEISFNRFAQETASDWTKLSQKLYAAWRKKMPPGVTLEDVRQEMLLHAWIAIGRYDPERGMPLKSYVVFTACAKASRFIHSQRNSLRRADSHESRYPIAFSEMGTVTENWIETLARFEPEPELRIDAKSKFARALEEAKGLERCALLSFREAAGDILEAAELLYDALPACWRISHQWDERKAINQIETALQSCAV